MKKLISVLLTVVMLTSILSGCSLFKKPMDVYKEEVEEAGIEESYDEIKTKAEELNDFLDSFMDDVDVTVQDISELDEYTQAIDMLDELKELIDDTIAKAEGFETKNDEVKEANDDLLAALGQYKHYCELVDRVFALAIEATAIMNSMSITEEELMLLDYPSDEVAIELSTVIYSDELSNVNIDEIFNSEGIDVDVANDMISKLQTAVDAFKNISATNETDQKYVQYFTDTYSVVIEIIKLFIKNEDVAVIFNDNEDGFLKDISAEAEKNFESWEEAISK